ncbi:DUF421 domain-containing protein [Hymenobacter sp. HD11105]
MKKEEIFLGDWQRILLGNAPVEFLVEVVLRTVIIYLALLLTMRIMGKRMNAQLTITELSVMIMLGGIVSVPMQIPERGLLHGILILGCILVLFRSINWLAYRYRRVELLAQGELQIIVADGVLDREQMITAHLSREQLFASLRAQKIQHLGELKRVYLEANGEFSVYQQKPPRPGLSILPEKDSVIHGAEHQEQDLQACLQCGYTTPEPDTQKQSAACPKCGCPDWTYAITSEPAAV